MNYHVWVVDVERRRRETLPIADNHQDIDPPTITISRLSIIKVKTFNNGSLGSGIDEERSEMRYVM